MADAKWVESDKRLPRPNVVVEVMRGFGVQRMWLDEPNGYWTLNGWGRCHTEGTKWRPIKK